MLAALFRVSGDGAGRAEQEPSAPGFRFPDPETRSLRPKQRVPRVRTRRCRGRTPYTPEDRSREQGPRRFRASPSFGATEEVGAAYHRQLGEGGLKRGIGFLDRGLSLFAKAALGHDGVEGGRDQSGKRKSRALRRRQCFAYAAGELAGEHAKWFDARAPSLGHLHAALHQGLGREKQRVDRSLRTDGPALAAAGAQHRLEGRDVRRGRRLQGERGGQRRQGRDGESRLWSQMLDVILFVEDTNLIPEASQAGYGRRALRPAIGSRRD